MSITLDQTSIKDHIIHRHENLLLDTVTLDEHGSGAGELTLTIDTSDRLGRQLFLKKIQGGSLVLSSPVMMEILALASIVVSGKLKPDEMAIFAGISNFVLHQDHLAGTLLKGSISKTSDKAGFYKYSGTVFNDNGPVASGDMTAFFTNTNHSNPEPTAADISFPHTLTLPTSKETRGKNPAMVVCDSLVHADDTSFISQYQYPTDHPLVKGHFPGNPLMMGIMQWMAIEDGLCAFLEQGKSQGKGAYACDARIYNQDKILVADIKQVQLSWEHSPDRPAQASITATKRLSFKYMVRPGDTLTIHCQNIQLA